MKGVLTMGNLLVIDDIKGGVKTNTFAQITMQKSCLDIRSISKELFYQLCKEPVLNADSVNQTSNDK